MVPEFKVGDLVRLKQNGRSQVPGIHEVVEVVAGPTSTERQYRVRSARAAAEKTVSERQISRA